MKQIMEFLKQYISKHGFALLFGDELTVERIHGVLEDMQRGNQLTRVASWKSRGLKTERSWEAGDRGASKR